jgi:hypothetical protein
MDARRQDAEMFCITTWHNYYYPAELTHQETEKCDVA